MKKTLKINHTLFTLAIAFLVVQIGIIIVNAVMSELPWNGEMFTGGSLVDKIVILAIYFILGVAAIICGILSFTVNVEKRQQLSARQRLGKLALCAMFLALYIVIQSASVDITAALRITFNFLVYGAVGMFFGPGTGAVFGVAADIMGYMVHSGVGGFFPAYTVIGAIKGVVYGVGLYRGPLRERKKAPSIKNVLAVKAVDTLLCNIILMTTANAFLYRGELSFAASFISLFPMRALKNIALFPLEAAMLYFILKVLFDINKKMKTKF